MSVFLSEADSDADLFQRFGHMFMNYSFVVVDMGSSIGSAKDFNFKIHNKSTSIQKFERNHYFCSILFISSVSKDFYIITKIK